MMRLASALTSGLTPSFTFEKDHHGQGAGARPRHEARNHQVIQRQVKLSSQLEAAPAR
jgi:hypothetical protein